MILFADRPEDLELEASLEEEEEAEEAKILERFEELEKSRETLSSTRAA